MSEMKIVEGVLNFLFNHGNKKKEEKKDIGCQDGILQSLSQSVRGKYSVNGDSNEMDSKMPLN